MRLMPWMKADCSMSGRPVTCMSGSRCRSSSNITRISRRARFAPRQKCGPPAPKPTWSFGVRVTSKRYASLQNASSRFAELYQRTTLSPGWIRCAPISTSRVAVGRKGSWGVADAEDEVRELEDAPMVGLGNTHHVADDAEGERGGHLPDEVARPLVCHRIDDPLRLRPDRLLDLVDGAGREPGAHQLPELRV